MIEEIDFETYLYVSRDMFQVFVYDKINQKTLYNEELKIYEKFDFQNFNNLSKFLDNNIFKIEKQTNQFIKNINLVIEDNNFLNIETGIKKNNFDQPVFKKDQITLLNYLKNDFKKNYPDLLIIHFIINKFIIDGKNFESLDTNIDYKNICLETTFICYLKKHKLILDDIFKKYQISISKLISAKYAKKLFLNDSLDICQMAYKVYLGYNYNEVAIIPKVRKTNSFFERFFHLFS